MDPRQLNHHAAALAVWAYAVAQLPELLPRNESAPPAIPSSGSASPAASAQVAIGVGVSLAVLVALGVGVWAARRNGACSSGSGGGKSADQLYQSVLGSA